ncbi:hypothetical protein PENSPDRAFT_587198, partial [Peniophora sp. CONT]
MNDYLRSSGLALEFIKESVHKEMDVAVKEMYINLKSLTPDKMHGWSIERDLQPAVRATPTLTTILLAAAETPRAEATNVLKKPQLMCSVVVSQLVKQRSQNSGRFAALVGLFLFNAGTQSKVINFLARCGLSISRRSIKVLLNTAATYNVEMASMLVKKLHLGSYDNINFKMSIHVEQLGNFTPEKVHSGTFGLVAEIFWRDGKPNPAALNVENLLQNLMNCPDLAYAVDLRLPDADATGILREFASIGLKALFRYVKGFEAQANDPSLRPEQIRPLPPKHRTKFYPTRVVNIEESSTDGNLDYHDELWVKQLGLTPEQLDELILLFLNLDWALHNKHSGSKAEPGSLTWFYTLLRKKRL